MWMKHAEHGGVADLPDIEYWRAQGWQPTDGPPPEPNILKDPLPDVPAATTTEAPVKTPGLSAAKTAKPASAAKTEES